MEYREFKIPKKRAGLRKITAPDAELLSYQRGKLPELETFWEDIAASYGIDDVQHGFIKNRNCVTAAEKHIGYQTTISMDIADFFDTVTKDFIEPFSTTYSSDPYLYHKDGYCSQGFATSPILCNIALIPTIAELNQYLEENYEDSVLTIYADDITISVQTTDNKELNNIIQAVKIIFTNNKFQIKPSKTRIRFAKHGFRRILGIMVGDNSTKIPRRTKYKLRAARHQALTAKTPEKRQYAGQSAGGLSTWSQLQLPKILR